MLVYFGKTRHEKILHFAYAKTKAQTSFTVSAKLIGAFFVLLLSKSKISSLYPSSLLVPGSVCVGLVRKLHCWFSNNAAHIV